MCCVFIIRCTHSVEFLALKKSNECFSASRITVRHFLAEIRDASLRLGCSLKSVIARFFFYNLYWWKINNIHKPDMSWYGCGVMRQPCWGCKGGLHCSFTPSHLQPMPKNVKIYRLSADNLAVHMLSERPGEQGDASLLLHPPKHQNVPPPFQQLTF